MEDENIELLLAQLIETLEEFLEEINESEIYDDRDEDGLLLTSEAATPYDTIH